MPTEFLKGAGSSSVEIQHHGAHVISWKNSVGREVIYTSPTAVYDGKKAIRGGIPICFPQFAKNGPLRQHGFARNMPWRLDDTFEGPKEGAAARFILESTPETQSSEWGYAFSVEYTVTLSADGNTLTIDMKVENKDERPFSFTTALHSYFTCDPEHTNLPDLAGVKYIDSIDPNSTGPKLQEGSIKFGKEVDRVYTNTPDVISLPSAGLTIRKANMPEAVIWNPYIEKSVAMGDLPDDGWRSFICIEPARVEEPATVEPGSSWSCQLALECASA